LKIVFSVFDLMMDAVNVSGFRASQIEREILLTPKFRTAWIRFAEKIGAVDGAFENPP
jgi:hypothetical protein